MNFTRGIALSLALFAVFVAVYVLSVVRTSFDSMWSIHTSMSLAEGDGGDLRKYLPLLDRHNRYSILHYDDRYYTSYPVGASLLTVPIVAAAAWWDGDFKQRLAEAVPDKFEQRVASIYGAIAAVLFFWLIYQRFSSVPIALASAGIFAFCTSMWSTATRALWQHGPLVLMLVLAMMLLLRGRRQPSAVQYAAIPLAFAFVIRPTAAIPIAVLSLYVLVRHRAWFIRFALFGAAIGLPWVAYNLHEFGTVLPLYYQPAHHGETTMFGEALLGNLVSPSRGLFVFSPVFLLSLSGFVLSLRHRDERLLHICFGVIIVLHWLVVSRQPIWWAGVSFGPRFMTDIVPFLTYFLAFNFDLIERTTGWRRWAFRGLVVVLAAASMLIHGLGATSPSGIYWNDVPQGIDMNDRARLWDWKDPQFARSLLRP